MTSKDRMDAKADVKLVTSLLILALLGLSAFLSDIWKPAPAGEESLEGVTGALFDRFVFAFELLSVLLLAALVGAVVIGISEREEA